MIKNKILAAKLPQQVLVPPNNLTLLLTLGRIWLILIEHA